MSDNHTAESERMESARRDAQTTIARRQAEARESLHRKITPVPSSAEEEAER